MRLLIVDDNEVVRMILANQLAEAGYSVESAGDGVEGLSAFRGDQFRVVICDWEMPGMDGLELCRSIRKLPGGRDTYIIMLTGRDTQLAEMEGLDAGADAFITKPYSPTELLSAIRTAEMILGRGSQVRKAS